MTYPEPDAKDPHSLPLQVCCMLLLLGFIFVSFVVVSNVRDAMQTQDVLEKPERE